MKNPFTKSKNVGQLTPSIYHQQPYKRGERDFSMTRSNLVEFNTCPHRWRAGFERDDSDSTDFGNRIDTLLLMPDEWHKQYVKRPAQYPSDVGSKTKGYTTEMKKWNSNSTWCKEWLALQGGKVAVDPVEYEANLTLAERLRKDFEDILVGAQTQVCVVAEYHDAATGLSIPVKCLIDAAPTLNYTRSLFDLKTCRCAHPAARSKFIFAFGYHVQAAMELDLWNAANPYDQREDFRFFGCENVPPYEPFRALLSEEFLKIGRATYTAALRRYAACLASGHWPGYDEGQREIDGFPLVEPASWMADAGFSAGWDESEKEAFPGLKKTNNEAETT